MTHYPRAITADIVRGLRSTPVVFVTGPRQAGKSTLVSEIGRRHLRARYVTFDHLSQVSAASQDPEGFLRGFTPPVVIDEVQAVPDLFLAIKQQIDGARLRRFDRPTRVYGLYLLTGSANILALPKLASALVGRMFIYTLFPLSAGEMLKSREGFTEALFTPTWSRRLAAHPEDALEEIVAQATFPELAVSPRADRATWFDTYVTTLLQRDVRALAEIEKLAAVPNLLRLLASRAGGLLNDAALARDAALNVMTYRRYRAILEAVFLLITVPPWYRNVGKRLVKAPKVYLTDTSLLCHLLGVELRTLRRSHHPLFGAVVENFVASELTKQLSRQHAGTLYHFRTYEGHEVDFVIERRDGRLAAIEVKASATVRAEDFRGLRALQELVGLQFVSGVVLYLGTEVVSFGERLHALPLSSLWRLAATPLDNRGT